MLDIDSNLSPKYKKSTTYIEFYWGRRSNKDCKFQSLNGLSCCQPWARVFPSPMMESFTTGKYKSAQFLHQLSIERTTLNKISRNLQRKKDVVKEKKRKKVMTCNFTHANKEGQKVGTMAPLSGLLSYRPLTD